MKTEKAIERIKAFRDYLCAGNPIWDVGECKEAFDIAIAAMEQRLMPAADVPDRKVGKWIPVSEGSPKENGRYFVTRGLNACGALWNRVYLINYSDLMGIKSERIWWDGNVGKSDFQKINDVIAWCELPEPWRGEDHG